MNPTNKSRDSRDQFLLGLESIVNKAWSKYADSELRREVAKKIINIWEFSGDQEIHDVLVKLAAMITNKFTTKKMTNLALEVQALAIGILPDPNVEWGNIPQELWEKILLSTPSREKYCVDGQFTIKSDLKNFAVISHEFNKKSKEAKKNWIDQEMISLKTYAKTADEAINYAITYQLTSVNLREFKDLTYNHLKFLMENCPNLKKLDISGDMLGSWERNITTLPPIQNSQLEVLIIDCCRKLESLPNEYLNLKMLSSQQCYKLRSLPEVYSNLEELNCSHCPTVESLPKEYIKLRKLNCSYCKFQFIPKEYINLENLDCHKNDNLELLPDCYKKLRKLDCHFCPKLSKSQKLVYESIQDFKW